CKQRTDNFGRNGRALPGETAVRTAVPGGSMVRMGSAVRFRRGAPPKPAAQAGSSTRPAACPEGWERPLARDLPETTVCSCSSTLGGEHRADPCFLDGVLTLAEPRTGLGWFSSGVAQRR